MTDRPAIDQLHALGIQSCARANPNTVVKNSIGVLFGMRRSNVLQCERRRAKLYLTTSELYRRCGDFTHLFDKFLQLSEMPITHSLTEFRTLGKWGGTVKAYAQILKK